MDTTSQGPASSWKEIVQNALAEAPEGVLKPGFTALPNVLWDSGILFKLKPSAALLLMALYRFTTGYLRSWTCIGETRLLEMTGLSSSTFYEAKRSLCQLGYIQVTHHHPGGRCEYRIAPHLQALRPELDDLAAKPVKRRLAGVPSGQSERHPSGQSEPCKESKEKNDQHQPYQPTQPFTRLASGDDESSSDFPAYADGSNTRPGLVDQLKRLGVSEFMAHKLTREKSPETIVQAISRLKHVPLENPAGYLVSEILRGGYGEMKADKTAAVRLEHQKIQDLRRSQREREAQEREQSASRVGNLLHRFELLPAEQQEKIRHEALLQAQREGFIRIPGWGESHPLYRGLLSEVVAAAVGEQLSTRLRE